MNAWPLGSTPMGVENPMPNGDEETAPDGPLIKCDK